MRPPKPIGRVHLVADVVVGVPSPADVVAMSFDGVTLFDAAFSDFVEKEPGVYVNKEKNTLAKLDLSAMQLTVVASDVGLIGVDNGNGIEVVLVIGDSVAVDIIHMRPSAGNRLVYVR